MDSIALLRAVNVVGNNLVGMSDLRSLFAKLGFPGAQTWLQSGNVVFKGDGRPDAELERLFEAETEKRLKLKVDYMVRSAKEWERIVARNPFPKEAKSDPSHLVVMVCKSALDGKAVQAMLAAHKGPEVFRADGRQAYITYPEGIGRSKMATSLIEPKLGVRGTGRNWNTVLKLLELTR